MPTNGSFFGPLEELIQERRMRLETIIEHRSDEEVPVVGHVAYEGSHGYTGFAIGWSHDRMNRTTVFMSGSWKLVKSSDTIFFLIRIAPDEEHSDRPWKTANLYTLLLRDRTAAGL